MYIHPKINLTFLKCYDIISMLKEKQKGGTTMNYVVTMGEAINNMENAIRVFGNDFDSCVDYMRVAEKIVDSTVSAMEDDEAISFNIYDAHYDFACIFSRHVDQLFFNYDDLNEMTDLLQDEADWLEAVLP